MLPLFIRISAELGRSMGSAEGDKGYMEKGAEG